MLKYSIGVTQFNLWTFFFSIKCGHFIALPIVKKKKKRKKKKKKKERKERKRKEQTIGVYVA